MQNRGEREVAQLDIPDNGMGIGMAQTTVTWTYSPLCILNLLSEFFDRLKVCRTFSKARSQWR